MQGSVQCSKWYLDARLKLECQDLSDLEALAKGLYEAKISGSWAVAYVGVRIGQGVMLQGFLELQSKCRRGGLVSSLNEMLGRVAIDISWTPGGKDCSDRAACDDARDFKGRTVDGCVLGPVELERAGFVRGQGARNDVSRKNDKKARVKDFIGQVVRRIPFEYQFELLEPCGDGYSSFLSEVIPRLIYFNSDAGEEGIIPPSSWREARDNVVLMYNIILENIKSRVGSRIVPRDSIENRIHLKNVRFCDFIVDSLKKRSGEKLEKSWVQISPCRTDRRVKFYEWSPKEIIDDLWAFVQRKRRLASTSEILEEDVGSPF